MGDCRSLAVGEWVGNIVGKRYRGFVRCLAGGGAIFRAWGGFGAAEHDAGYSVCRRRFAGLFDAVALWAVGELGLVVQCQGDGCGADAVDFANSCGIDSAVDRGCRCAAW